MLLSKDENKNDNKKKEEDVSAFIGYSQISAFSYNLLSYEQSCAWRSSWLVFNSVVNKLCLKRWCVIMDLTLNFRP